MQINQSNDNKIEKYDVVILGGGAAGLSAGLYSTRAMLSTLVLESVGYGGQVLITDVIDNSNESGIISIFAVSQLNEELKYFEDGLLRNNHLDYLFIHKDIFNRQNIEELIINNLFYESKNKKLVIENLDTYSIGILLPMIIRVFCFTI